jgi:hypothetical protein
MIGGHLVNKACIAIFFGTLFDLVKACLSLFWLVAALWRFVNLSF